jgi:hypothetical protein
VSGNFRQVIGNLLALRRSQIFREFLPFNSKHIADSLSYPVIMVLGWCRSMWSKSSTPWDRSILETCADCCWSFVVIRSAKNAYSVLYLAAVMLPNTTRTLALASSRRFSSASFSSASSTALRLSVPSSVWPSSLRVLPEQPFELMVEQRAKFASGGGQTFV